MTQPSSIVLIRGGEGIQEPVNLPDTIAAMLEIDSTVPLRNRGLVPDCKRAFDLDFYIPQNIRFFFEAEQYVQVHRKFGKMYEELKAKIFAAYPIEEKNWDEIRIQRLDAHGSGALWIQGVLKVYCAIIGRQYEPTKRDADPMLPIRRQETRGDHKGTIWVSMLTDLIHALVELQPDEVGLVCGAFGGTGPSVSAVLGDVLADLKYNIVRVQLVSMPDSFMTNEHTPSEVADRLAAVMEVLHPLAAYSGLGWKGVFWHFLGKEMRTIGERFSNVMQKKMVFGAAPIITVVGVPFREDLRERWMVGQSALHPITPEEARSRLLQAKENDLVSFDLVPYQRGKGVRIRVSNPNRRKIWEWELLLPALTAARSGIGRMKLPAMVTTNGGGILGIGKKEELQELLVESVPLMDNLMERAGVRDVNRLAEATAFWALTRVERKMLERCRQMTIDDAFEHAIPETGIQTAREILSETIFAAQNLFPPASTVFDEPAKAYFMWGQVNLGMRALADELCGYFGTVDRSKEEQAAIRRAEEERQAAIMEKVTEQLMATMEPEEEEKK